MTLVWRGVDQTRTRYLPLQQDTTLSITLMLGLEEIMITLLLNCLLSRSSICLGSSQDGRGQLAVYYTSPQSFIIFFGLTTLET